MNSARGKNREKNLWLAGEAEEKPFPARVRKNNPPPLEKRGPIFFWFSMRAKIGIFFGFFCEQKLGYIFWGGIYIQKNCFFQIGGGLLLLLLLLT